MTDSSYNDRPAFAGYTIVLLILMCLYGVGISLSGVSYEKLFREGGFIETLSVIAYFATLALCLIRGGLPWLRTHYDIAAILIFLGLRELDFDKRFTTMGIFKSKFFASGEVAATEKIIGAIVILLLAALIIQLSRKYTATLILRLKKCDAVTFGVWIAFLVLLFSKAIDGLDRKLKGFGIEISYLFTENAAALEETLELGAPVILLIAANAYFRERPRVR